MNETREKGSGWHKAGMRVAKSGGGGRKGKEERRGETEEKDAVVICFVHELLLSLHFACSLLAGR